MEDRGRKNSPGTIHHPQRFKSAILRHAAIENNHPRPARVSISHHLVFGWVAGLFLIAGMGPYVRAVVITRTTKPNRASWAIWAGIGIINFAAYFVAGERITIWFLAAAAGNSVILFFLSLKFGEKKWRTSDTVCLLLAFSALGIWKLTGNPITALAMGITADALAVIPTFLKVRRSPDSECLASWLCVLAASACNLLGVDHWTWANGLYNIYAFFGSVFLVVPLALGQRKLVKAQWQRNSCQMAR